MNPFPWTYWLEGEQGLDGDDENLAALLRFRSSEKFRKDRRKGRKEGLAGDDLG